MKLLHIHSSKTETYSLASLSLLRLALTVLLVQVILTLAVSLLVWHNILSLSVQAEASALITRLDNLETAGLILGLLNMVGAVALTIKSFLKMCNNKCFEYQYLDRGAKQHTLVRKWKSTIRAKF